MRRALLIAAILVVLASASMGTSTAQQTSWVAYLSAGESVPRVNSQATATAIFQMTPSGLTYWAYLNGITNVIMGHIHIAAPGVAGPVAVWLYPAAPPPVAIPGSYSGLVSQGTITPANFVGPLANQPMSALINAINAGNAYVQFHTQANPGGEIRGQIR
jgi:hypothetical protein